ncbi:MAG: LL-diaminopimelate aminotransferase [Phycisphaerales bacterium]|nr:LL-diaminopimelate aminotransferase [Phycisphaerales bacterium]
MFRINENFLKLSAGYLFPEIARRVALFAAENPAVAARIIRCGIGDVTEPIPAAAADAMRKAIDDLTRRESFHGYPPPAGYDFVRAAIAQGDFRSRGCDIADDEIFLSDGSKPDASAILEILGVGNRVAITDPVYPVYADTNVMAGNSGGALEGGGYAGFTYLPSTPQNDFSPALPTTDVDVIYLCSPNNPTGVVLDHAALTRWVQYARAQGAVILFDAAYEAFIRTAGIPHSIYEIDGATECAIEFRSFSKVGGFTGVRCGYTVMPKALCTTTSAGKRVSLHALWTRRWSTCSNGVSWPVQCAAAALYSPAGREQTRALTDFYLANARLISRACESMGLKTYGATNSPYVWMTCPVGLGSWDAFDLLLREAQVVTTPGAGFGRCGEGFIRISAFQSRENIEEVVRRLAVLAPSATR